MNSQRLECVLLSIIMIQCIGFQLYWNGRAYIDGFKNIPDIAHALWQLTLYFFHIH